MTEPSDLARDVLARYRRSISPSSSARDVLVDNVARRVGEGGGSGPSGGGAAGPSGHGSPWLVVVGIAIVIAGGAWWSARPDVGSPIEPAFGSVGALAPVEIEPPVIASSAVARVEPPAPAMSYVPPVAEPVAPSPRPRGPRVAARTPVASEPAPEPALVDEEVRLLREANLALKEGRDAEARARFDEHARRFPAGSLVELREVGRARMRCKAATADEATEIIATFGREFPGSPHLARLERECPRTGAQ